MASERTQRRDLSDLVRQRRAELGLSLRAVALRTAPPGDDVPVVLQHTFIDRLEKADPRVRPLGYAELEALARSLELPLRLVQEAAGRQFMGLEVEGVWSEDGSTRVVVARMAEMTPEERQQLQQIAETFAARRRGEKG